MNQLALNGAVAAVMLSIAGGASAADDQQAELNARIDALERRIAVLEDRVRVLEAPAEGSAPAADPVPRASPGQWKDANNWQRLKVRMMESEVEGLLGRPERTRSVGKFEYWYYGESRVVFYLGRVESWQAP